MSHKPQNFRPDTPADGPVWLPRFADSVANLFRRMMPAPLKLHGFDTAELPPAADYSHAIAFDHDEGNAVVSDGTDWKYWSFSDHVHAAEDVTFAPAGNIAATDVQAAIEELDTEKLAASSYTADDVLAKLLTVDGAGSGLDADLLDGSSSAAFAAAAHTHTLSNITDSGTMAAQNSTAVSITGGTIDLTGTDILQITTSRTNDLTLSITQASTHQRWTSVSRTCTIPPNSSVAFPTGSWVMLVNDGSGTLTIARGVGVALTWGGADADRSVASPGWAKIIKIATDSWYVIGNGIT